MLRRVSDRDTQSKGNPARGQHSMSQTPAQYRSTIAAHKRLFRAMDDLTTAADMTAHVVSDKASTINTIAKDAVQKLMDALREEGLDTRPGIGA